VGQRHSRWLPIKIDVIVTTRGLLDFPRLEELEAANHFANVFELLITSKEFYVHTYPNKDINEDRMNEFLGKVVGDFGTSLSSLAYLGQKLGGSSGTGWERTDCRTNGW